MVEMALVELLLSSLRAPIQNVIAKRLFLRQSPTVRGIPLIRKFMEKLSQRRTRQKETKKGFLGFSRSVMTRCPD